MWIVKINEILCNIIVQVNLHVNDTALLSPLQNIDTPFLTVQKNITSMQNGPLTTADKKADRKGVWL